MLKKILVPILVTLLLTSCASYVGRETVNSFGENTSRQLYSGPFHAVNSGGFVNVNIIVGGNSHTIQGVGDAAVLQHMNIEDKNGVLTVEPVKNIRFTNAGKVMLNIATPRLTQFKYAGSGTVSIHNINTPKFTVLVSGSGLVRLYGHTNHLIAETMGQGQLDATGLIAQDGYVNTAGKSSAAVNVTGNLYALATGQSNIFYYGKPHFAGDLMQYSGAVLPMRYLKQAEFYLPKNKYHTLMQNNPPKIAPPRSSIFGWRDRNAS